MKNYKITVNDEVYEVTVEELDDQAFASQKQENMTQKAQPVQEKQESTPSTGTGVVVNAPMAGTIFKVLVNEGEAVKSGQVVLILEAMKMENEIVAPEDGVVSKIHVQQGQQVDSGATLIIL